MKSIRISIYLLIAMALCLVAAPAMAQNVLTVSPAAAIDGAFGLAVTMDGSNNKADVRNFCPNTSGCPNDETSYRASFKVDMNNLAMNDLIVHNIFTLRARAGGPLGISNRNEARVSIRFRQGQTNPYKIQLACRTASRQWRFIGQHSLPPSGVRTIEVRWQAASAPAANDGICQMLINGVLRGEDNTIPNEGRAIGEVWLGVDGVSPGTIGTMYYDTFESFRTLAP